MAVRDRNLFAWQAYVIVASFFSVILLGTTFWGFMSASTYSKQLDDLKKTSSEAQTESNKRAERVNRLKAMLGYGEYSTQELEQMAENMKNDPELSEIEKDFAEQMRLFEKSDKEKNLLKLPKLLTDTVRIRNQEAEAARKREEQLLKDKADVIALETTKTKEALQKMEMAQKDLESERSLHASQIEALNTEKEEMTKKFEENKKLFDKQLAAKNQLIASLEQKTKDQTDRIARLQEELNSFNTDDFQTPQGEITRVVDGGNEIWLNLGREDGLREGVIFKVFDASNVTLRKPEFDRTRFTREEWEKLPLEKRLAKGADPKATVQVTHVFDNHSARAKVLDANNRSRPTTRDWIFSPGWRSGRTIGFVLTGFERNKEEFETIKQLITSNGGRIDDKILPGTVYLVLGPDTKLNETPTPDELDRYRKIAAVMKEAKENSLNVMQYDTLMTWLRPKNAERIVPLTRSSDDDFQRRLP